MGWKAASVVSEYRMKVEDVVVLKAASCLLSYSFDLAICKRLFKQREIKISPTKELFYLNLEKSGIQTEEAELFSRVSIILFKMSFPSMSDNKTTFKTKSRQFGI